MQPLMTISNNESKGFSNKHTMTLQFYKKFQVPMGKGLYASGNLPELGCWDPKKSVKLFWHKGDNWRQEVQLKIRTLPLKIEYKFIIMAYDNPKNDDACWQNGPNNTIRVTYEALNNLCNPVINVMSFNIRCDIDKKPERTWNARKNSVLQMIQSKTLDFCGVQEAFYHQYTRGRIFKGCLCSYSPVVQRPISRRGKISLNLFSINGYLCPSR